jgi:hypothetical protein
MQVLDALLASWAPISGLFLLILVSASTWQPACAVHPTSVPRKLGPVLFLPGCPSACLSPTSFHIVSSIQSLPGQRMWFVVEELTVVDACPPLHFCAMASSVNSRLACGSATVLGAGHASVRKISLLLWMLRCNVREPAGNRHLEKHVLSNCDEYYGETGRLCSGDLMVRGARQPQVGNPESQK